MRKRVGELDGRGSHGGGRRRLWALWAVCLAAAAVGWSCGGRRAADSDARAEMGGRGEEPRARRLVVTVTTPALGWLVERLGGASVQVEELGVEALDPSFAPTAEQVLAMSEADLLVARGRRIERWLETVSLPTSRLVESTDLLEPGAELLERDGPTHSHGAEGEHSHRVVEPGTQLDPALFARQVERVAGALRTAAATAGAGELAGSLRDGEARLIEELGALSERYRELGELAGGAGITACSAPAGGVDYACRALGLDPRAFGRPAQKGLELVLWPVGVPDPPMSTGSIVVPLDPLERARDGDASQGFAYLERQRSNLERLSLALRVE